MSINRSGTYQHLTPLTLNDQLAMHMGVFTCQRTCRTPTNLSDPHAFAWRPRGCAARCGVPPETPTPPGFSTDR